MFGAKTKKYVAKCGMREMKWMKKKNDYNLKISEEVILKIYNWKCNELYDDDDGGNDVNKYGVYVHA